VNVITRHMFGIYISKESILGNAPLPERELFVTGKNAIDAIHEIDYAGDDISNRGYIRIAFSSNISRKVILVDYIDTVQNLKDALLEWENSGKINGRIDTVVIDKDLNPDLFRNHYKTHSINKLAGSLYEVSKFTRHDYSVKDETKKEGEGTSLKTSIEENNTVKDIEKHKTAGTTNLKPEKPKSEFWGNIRLIVFLSVFLGGLVLFYAVVGNPDSFPIISKLIVNIIAIVALFFVCSFLGGLVSDYLFHDKNESIITNFIRGLIVLALIFLFGWLSFDFSGMFDSRGAP